MEILKVIEENFLVVRRLPFETETLFNYREGDEERYKKPAFYSNGKPVDYKNVEIFVENLDIEWFKKLLHKNGIKIVHLKNVMKDINTHILTEENL